MGSYLVCTVTSHSPLSHVGGRVNKKAAPKRYKLIVYKQKNINLVLIDTYFVIILYFLVLGYFRLL